MPHDSKSYADFNHLDFIYIYELQGLILRAICRAKEYFAREDNDQQI